MESVNGTKKGEPYQCLDSVSCVCYPFSKEEMAQEALKTQIDSLQWEINCLDAENRKLRESNLERSQFIDLKSELALAKEDVSNLTGKVDLQRQQLYVTVATPNTSNH